MTRSDVTLHVCSWNSPASSAENTGLYLARSMSAKQSGLLQNLWTNAGTCVNCTTNHILATPPAVTSDYEQRLIDTQTSISRNVSDKQLINVVNGYVQAWRQNDITLNICGAQTGYLHSQHATRSFQSHQQSTKENMLFRVILLQLF